MSSDRLLKILHLCQAMDVMSARVYTRLSSLVDDAELAEYWLSMANEEAEHMAFWEQLIPLAEKGMIPEIFDEPSKVIGDLEHNMERAQELEKKLAPGVSAKDAFIIAFRLEYYLLHPVFEAFFSYARELRPIAEIMRDGSSYDAHIGGLINALGRFCGEVPEMELLSDTIKTLWWDNRRMAKTINTDGLTGLLNRRGFFNSAKPFMDLARRDDRNIGLILADMDDFKGFNAARGHDAGDILLKNIGLALQQVVRSSDIVARFGGEEFIVLFYALEKDSLADVADKIRKTINSCSHNGSKCTASVGAASLESLAPGGGPCCVNLEEVLSQATKNLEEAKKLGRDQVVAS